LKLPNTKSVLEAAAALKTSQVRILQMIREKKLDAINVGNGKSRPRWAIPDAAIEALSAKPQTNNVVKKKIPKNV